MDLMIHPRILEGFGLDIGDYTIKKVGTGLINNTFKLEANDGTPGKDLILQRINTHVFKRPWRIAANLQKADDYLTKNFPDYFFPAPLPTAGGKELLECKDEYWRKLPFVEHTVTINEADNPKQAYEAAKQFGRLAKNLSGINLDSFHQTIPDFHNLTLRYNNFQTAIANASPERKKGAEDLVNAFQPYSEIAVTYERLNTNPDFPDRLMHHDTKINNVMFDDQTYEGICVIDLDTLMPGKVISDLGDMIRTYVSPVSEEETDSHKISIRDNYYEALIKGYLSEMGPVLTPVEEKVLFYSGQFMIYMQGIRFLTDYLNGDVYYTAKYPAHNYNRAKNQLTLLEAINKKEKDLKSLITKHLS